jgi:hypothetical protein
MAACDAYLDGLLENEFYLQVDRAEVRFYDQQMLFGEAVAKKFKDAAYDIQSAPGDRQGVEGESPSQ